MDRNSTIGLVLISVLLFAYFAFFAPEPQQTEQKTATTTAQTDVVKPQEKAPVALPDSVLQQQLGSLAPLANGQEKEYVLENKDLKITFSTKGGKVKTVLAKNYQTYRHEPVYLVDENATQLSFELPFLKGKSDLYSFYFNNATTEVKGDTTHLKFLAQLAPNQYIEQVYSLGKDGFTLGYDIRFQGITELNYSQLATISWKQKLRNFEKDAEQNRLSSNVNYYTTAGDFEKLSETSKDLQNEKVSAQVKWVALKQKFFNTALISRGALQNVEIASSVDMNDTEFVKYVSAKMEAPVSNSSYQFYFGPNQYQICKQVGEGFQENVYLGWPVLNNLNRFVTVPIFNFLERFFSNYGIIIFLLVLIIKLAMFPLSYKSYLSMAKIRVLKPELDEIKSKHGDDMQKTQAEQMKLYQSVGVNPIAGCVPVLLTMPILLAIFNFFPNSIELRQQAFLWADDLSTYDVIASIPFTIPFYGDHVSLFTILMTISTLVYTWYNNQMSSATMQGPMIAMSYIMPIVFMFVLNSLPAGLSYYYFISNVITIGQQMIIKNFVDEGQIRVQLEKNKAKIASEPSKQNRFMKRLEEAMKQQEELKKKKK
ncbi:MAG TPA: membrane protein insertase YidC [Cytophagales bacterium]|nr:membrane protein insertase YidC [Cytophagales bacterium]